MANGIRTGDPRGFNKGRSSKFCEGRNVVEITIKMKTIARNPLRIKILKVLFVFHSAQILEGAVCISLETGMNGSFLYLIYG